MSYFGALGEIAAVPASGPCQRFRGGMWNASRGCVDKRCERSTALWFFDAGDDIKNRSKYCNHSVSDGSPIIRIPEAEGLPKSNRKRREAVLLPERPREKGKEGGKGERAVKGLFTGSTATLNTSSRRWTSYLQSQKAPAG